MAEFAVDPEDVEEELGNVTQSRLDDGPQYPAMTFEEGVEAALAWVLGDREEKPFTEDD